MTDWHEIEPGTEVRVDGIRGAFVFRSVAPCGSITVWGGSKNPNGNRMFRSFDPERVHVYRPRKEHMKMLPGPSVTPPKRRGRR